MNRTSCTAQSGLQTLHGILNVPPNLKEGLAAVQYK